MATHELKTWPDSFQAVWDGAKTAEFRRDDRGFEVGDRLLLREYVLTDDRYTGREVEAVVTHVLRGPGFAVPEGYSLLSITVTSKRRA
jgi:hypothetical protein